MQKSPQGLLPYGDFVVAKAHMVLQKRFSHLLFLPLYFTPKPHNPTNSYILFHPI